ncbi:MAG: hypothetical protein KJ645_14735, partial [Planctomycetes bacterium]|nr:hypothetical protein [Planctomycetota bacterium]
VGNDFGSDTLNNGFTYDEPDPAIHVPGDYPTIQAAVDAALSGDLILVAPGTYVENLVIPAKEMTLRSDVDGDPGTEDLSPQTTFIDGNQNGLVILFQGGSPVDLSFSGFTITNGYNASFDYTAGGIYCEEDAAPAVTDNIIIANSCDFGTGGLKSDASNASQIVSKNVVCGNSSYFGGSGGVMIGGTDASHTVSDNIITGNRSEVNCGGLIITGISSNHSVVNNTLSGNYGAIGGGLSLAGYDANEIIVTNNTVIHNHGDQKAGGIAVGGGLTAYVVNTISWNNSAPVGPEISMNKAVLESSELFIGYSDVQGGQSQVQVDSTCTLNWGTGMIDADPSLSPVSVGNWTGNGSFNAATYQVTFVDNTASWTVDSLAGMLLNPDTSQYQYFYIVSNTADTVTIWVDWDTINAGVSWVSNGDGYQIYDYHLTGGSACIDTGNNGAMDLPTEDIDGDDRVLDGDGDFSSIVDMGADEFVL